MDLDEADALARELMSRHGLADWKLRWSGARRQFGSCSWTHRTLALSAPLTRLNPPSAFTDTVLHEIAHALAGHAAGHGPRWRRICEELGARPQRCFGAEVATPDSYRWVGRCPGCATTLHRYKLTRQARRLACLGCCRRHNAGRWTPRFQLVWTRLVPPDG